MKWLVRTVKRNLLMLVAGALIGLLALVVVHLLPTETMKANVWWSLESIEKEFNDELVIDGYQTTLTGSFTDCLMLEHAIYTSSNRGLLEQVLHMYRAESCYSEIEEEVWWPGQSLKDYLTNVEQPTEVEYGRYWHGYLVILKPLLLFTTVNGIRLLNSTLQLLILGAVIITMCRKNAFELAKAFLLSIPFLFFVSTFSSLSLSICYYIMMLALLVQLKWDGTILKHDLYGEFFLLLGMVTAYFDFLTYPLITLGYPLCVYFYFHGEDFVKNLKKMIWYSSEWFIGYIGLWASKWILTDLLTTSTTLKDAFETVLTRTDSAADASRIGGFIKVLIANMEVYASLSHVTIVAVVILLFVIGLRKAGIKSIKNNFARVAIWFVLALYPLGWYFVTQNHSEQHWQFTCRILSLSVFAGVLGVLCMIQKEKNKTDN